MTQILYDWLQMIIRDDMFMLFGSDSWDNLWKYQSGIKVYVLLVFSVEELKLGQDLFAYRGELLLVVYGQLKQSFEWLALEDQGALIQGTKQKVIILSIEIRHSKEQ